MTIEDEQRDPASEEVPADGDPTVDAVDEEPWDDDEWDDDELDRDKLIRWAQIGLAALIVVVVLGVVIAKLGGDDGTSSQGSGGSSGQETGPKKASWPANVGGRPPKLGTRGQAAPKVEPGAAPGIYLWSDYDGWHLWVVKGPGVPAISGTLTSNDKVAKAVLATPSVGSVTTKDKVVTYLLPTDAPIVGVDFNPGFYAKQLVFTLNGPDGPVDQALVHVGRKAEKAPYPLVIVKS